MIAVTGPDRGGWAAWLFTAWAVYRAGGRPLRVRPSHAHRDIQFDGIIVGGGADVNPERYEDPAGPGAAEIKASERIQSQRLLGYIFYPLLWLLRRLFQSRTGTADLERDILEEALIDQALNHDRPILGICRGMQLINVVCGGTLNRDLAGFYAETPRLRSVLPVKKVEMTAGSKLAEILNSHSVWVNALHDQAVDKLGLSLRVCGREPTNIIQAIEATDRWCIGVQWHPEYLPQKIVQRRLFHALIQEAARASQPGHRDDGV